MKRDEFINHVQSIAQLDSCEEAERAVRATLETLRERIVGDEAKDLASQLPSEFGEYLRSRVCRPIIWIYYLHLTPILR